jgi:CelD/BcsL family acetyltransferase involved in cellulose biosynthesis
MDSAAAALAPCDEQLQLDGTADTQRVGAPVSARLLPLREASITAAEWDSLAGEASEPNPFAERWFAEPGFRNLAGGCDVQLAEIRSGMRFIGLLPLVEAKHYGRLPVRNHQNWLHHHSFLGTPLIRSGQERSFWVALLKLLDGDARARSFLHINGLVEDGPVHRGLVAAAAELGRPSDVVHRSLRALLESSLSPSQYYEQVIRKKKRKELKRLQARLAEMGKVATRRLTGGSELDPWCDDFLALERAGWKGAEGSALGCEARTEAFFREAIAGAAKAGKLEFLRLDLDDKPLAMLVNFITPPGSFSFKIAFDEAFARFSPGVLLQLENLHILDRPDVGWMDSCAAEDHPMINSLWAERRSVVRVTVPLAGWRRRAVFDICRSAETGWAAVKGIFAVRTQGVGGEDA